MISSLSAEAARKDAERPEAVGEELHRDWMGPERRTMETVLRAEDLTKVYSSVNKERLTAVDHVSFSLQRGECLGIIGESGSGKSTLANIITRLQEPDSGHVFLEGEDLTAMRGRTLRKAYRKIQMVFQTPAGSFDPRRTLGDGIAESLRNMGMSGAAAKERTARLLEMCGLDPAFAKRYPHQVSIGQCQRAAIARALAAEPSVLICDEATSALDVTIQQEIVQLLEKLRQEQGRSLSILFICHDIALVEQFCDRVLVMYKGRIVEEGVPQEIIRRPQDAYTRRLIESIL